MARLFLVCALTLVADACATLGQLRSLMQAPRFTEARLVLRGSEHGY